MTKRLFDIVGALVGLIIPSPLYLIIYIAILWKLGGPVFFQQVRPGINGKPFNIVKFRSMTNALSEEGMQLTDADRLTPVGKFMRETSLDELPELWNVLKGEMSIVGPRPLLMEYLPLYTPEQLRRHDVRPGITGWAQVNGRNTLSWEEKFKLDLWYVDNQSLWLDIKILWLTVKKVLLRDGITSEGEATTKFFEGNKK